MMPALLKKQQRRAAKFSPCWASLGLLFALAWAGTAAAQQASGTQTSSADAQACSALVGFDLQSAPGGPAVITAAHLVSVPASGLEHFIFAPSGFASAGEQPSSRIHQYCEVTGYVAPQNKFDLKLPLPADWNQKFFFF